MRRALIALVLLGIATNAFADERLFFGYSADAILSACTAKSSGNYGFCLGFVYAIAYKLNAEHKSCAFALANLDPVLKSATNALAKTKMDLDKAKASHATRLATEAWPIIEAAFIKEYPCQS